MTVEAWEVILCPDMTLPRRLGGRKSLPVNASQVMLLPDTQAPNRRAGPHQ
jgi:hypothetical protein